MPDYLEQSIKEAINLIDLAITHTRKRQTRASLIAMALDLCIQKYSEDTEYCLFLLMCHIRDKYQ